MVKNELKNEAFVGPKMTPSDKFLGLISNNIVFVESSREGFELEIT
jgi:hypothetical protein